jgi:NOL1/NOP2/fmu family ribosome biogenesis protein
MKQKFMPKFTPLKILNQKEKKEIEEKLSEQFGIKNVPGIIAMRGKERIFFFSGSLNEKEIKALEEIVVIERLGVYFARLVEDSVKLSIEGTQILKDQIKKNIFELSESQAEEWMKGQDLQVKTGKRGFLAIKYKDDFLGCGKASQEKIGNFIPKSRRLKNRGN